jgi:hypothetical protein
VLAETEKKKVVEVVLMAGTGGRRFSTQLIHPPGGYGDGPVYLRVHRAKAGIAWPRPSYAREINDWRLGMDAMYDYVEADNSHSAFVYCRLLEAEGVSKEALAVVKIKT